ncbi:formylglycine-generating enzyme family protein [Rubinisphaera margarita]|uniref:formylglycine-generating enzyme family protein n=1 Tax=Rubinisphaera margarita TaxID=2909586 RepID=UPI001EE8D109|nr:formylglycine-generating enzyme family protein [Rubinisphaera margarita]MCG6157247.1 formylglycine-generating enzyme family protein [Rubinisphaera margarita]
MKFAFIAGVFGTINAFGYYWTAKVESEAAMPAQAIAPFEREEASEHQQRWANHLEIPFVHQNSLGMQMTVIPSGTFTMGAREEEFTSKDRERPRHSVTLTQPFLMAAHETTLGQFRQFVAEANYRLDPTRVEVKTIEAEARRGEWIENPEVPWEQPGFLQDDTHPVVNVSWIDAMAFCEWLSNRENRRYRLPTEAEWEFACRAGTDSMFYTGEGLWSFKPMDNHADQSLHPDMVGHAPDASPWNDGFPNTAPVGSFPPNPFGICDMHGNIREWCFDWFSEKTYTAEPRIDPVGPPSGNQRSLRGGNWGSNEYYCRSGKRMGRSPFARNIRDGFRVMCEIVPNEAIGPGASHQTVSATD